MAYRDCLTNDRHRNFRKRFNTGLFWPFQKDKHTNYHQPSANRDCLVCDTLDRHQSFRIRAARGLLWPISKWALHQFASDGLAFLEHIWRIPTQANLQAKIFLVKLLWYYDIKNFLSNISSWEIKTYLTRHQFMHFTVYYHCWTV